ncbi:hypothetical protein BCR32DRAFT_224759, partial [Anaeromyces robustus]
MTFINIMKFFYNTHLWIYFNSKEKFLPVGTSNNTIYYLAASVIDIESIAEDYISEMKKLINYLGEKNVMVSIVENGDSQDNSRVYLSQFQKYLNEKRIPNEFVLEHEVEDPRDPNGVKNNNRVIFYALLRNKALELLYKTQGIDFDNVKIIYFNDIVFSYKDIVKLISTNHENYDSVCAMDYYFSFYDRWVAYDLAGNSLNSEFPFFNNVEGQEQFINHKPIRIFSC